MILNCVASGTVRDDDLDDEIIEISSASDTKPNVPKVKKMYIAKHVKLEPGLEGRSQTSTANLWATFQNIAQSVNPQALALRDEYKKTHMFDTIQLQHLSTQLCDRKAEIDQLRNQLFQLNRQLDRESRHADNAEHDLQMNVHMGRVWLSVYNPDMGTTRQHHSPLTDHPPAAFLLYP